MAVLVPFLFFAAVKALGPPTVWSFGCTTPSPSDRLSFTLDVKNSDPSLLTNRTANSVTYDITIGTDVQRASSDSKASMYVAKGHSYDFELPATNPPHNDPFSQRAVLSFVADGHRKFYIGPNSTFMAAHNSSSLAEEVSTVPFAFALGRFVPPHSTVVTASGEIMFGGYFDTEQVGETYGWRVLYETLYGEGTFLRTGSQRANFTVAQGDFIMNMTVTLDINKDTTTLGAGFECSKTISLNPTDPDYTDPHGGLQYGYEGLTEPKNFCREDPSSDEHIFGKDFFQFMYTYVDTDGTMFLVNSNLPYPRRRAYIQAWYTLDKDMQIVNWPNRPKDPNAHKNNGVEGPLHGKRTSIVMALSAFAISSFAVVWL